MLTTEIFFQDINQAVRRSFATRIRLGMFNKKEDDPFANPDESLLGGSDHAALSRQAGREAIVLLKNEGQILPISPKEKEKIAVIGHWQMNGLRIGMEVSRHIVFHRMKE